MESVKSFKFQYLPNKRRLRLPNGIRLKRLKSSIDGPLRFFKTSSENLINQKFVMHDLGTQS